MRLTFPHNLSEPPETGYRPYDEGDDLAPSPYISPEPPSSAEPSPAYRNRRVEVPPRNQIPRENPRHSSQGGPLQPGPSTSSMPSYVARPPSLSPIAEAPRNRYETPPPPTYSSPPPLSQSVSPNANPFAGPYSQYPPSSSMAMDWEPTLGSHALAVSARARRPSPVTPTRLADGSPQPLEYADVHGPGGYHNF